MGQFSAPLKTAHGEEVDRTLKKVLQQSKEDHLDLTVGNSAKGHQARLVAVGVSEQEAQKRRRERVQELILNEEQITTWNMNWS